MAAHRVFVSYSRRDRKLFDVFRTHLAPALRSGLVELWTDQEILAGDDRDRKIHDAIQRADAAVVMVSPDMWASDYRVKEEVPELMEAHEAGRLRLLPLFLKPSDAATYEFPVVDASTGKPGIPITRYQGLNSPRAPLSAAEDRDAALVECVTKLRAALEELTVPWLRRRRRPEDRELTVELRLDGGRIERRFMDPPYGPILLSGDPVDLATLGDLDDPRLGERLFTVLFGAGDAWRGVLRKALGEDLGSPVLHAVRVRLATAEAGLRALPWALCRWRRYDLADRGWTFELAAEDDQLHPVLRLHTPCTVVMAAAEAEGLPELRAGIHFDTFKGLLDRVWKNPARKSFLTKAATPEELRRALAESPRLLYVYAHARARGGDLELVLRDDAGRPAVMTWSEVAAALGRRPPQAAVLHTVGDVPPAAPLPGVPLVLHLRRRAASWTSRQDAQVWWEDVLGRGADPVHALHDLEAAARRDDVVWTAYEAWQARHSDYVPKTDRPRSRLDRRTQRQAIWDAVRELVQTRARRVTCVVVYGAGGNLVDHFAEQAIDTLKDWAKDMARIHYRPLRFPAARDGLDVRRLEDTLRENLDLQPGQKLAALKPRRGGGRAKPVWFFDWGTYGPGHRPTLRSEDLETWLELACGALGRDCPKEARILSYVALAVDAGRHDELREWLEDLRRDPEYRQPHFDLVHLPALGQVSANDLLHFLEDEDNTSCPREYLADIPDRIVLATHGDFEKTVELLEKAERGTMWRELYRDLPEAPGAPRKRKGFKLE